MSESQQALDYSNRCGEGRRFSILAGVALAAAVVINPLLLKSLFGGPKSSLLLLFVPMSLPLVLALVASIRIGASRATLKGLSVALIALGISLFWWAMLLLISMAYSGHGRGRY